MPKKKLPYDDVLEQLEDIIPSMNEMSEQDKIDCSKILEVLYKDWYDEWFADGKSEWYDEWVADARA